MGFSFAGRFARALSARPSERHERSLTATRARYLTPRYDRVLAVVDFNRNGTAAATEASAIAHIHGAHFGLAHIAAWPCTDWPDFCGLPPVELEERMRRAITRKIDALARRVGASRAEAIVSFSAGQHGLADLTERWRPDLLVIATGCDVVIDPGLDSCNCSVIVVP